MRHLRSILYAIVLAPAVWALCGVGFARDPGFLPLLLAGVAYAILVLAPISPAGPLLAGVAFLGAGLWALASPSTYGDVWPATGSRIDLSAAGYGLAALLAVPLLGTALNGRRWQRHERLELPLVGGLRATPGSAQPVRAPETAPEEPPTEAVPAASVESSTATAKSTEEPEPVTAAFAVSSSGEVTDVHRTEVVPAAAEGEPAPAQPAPVGAAAAEPAAEETAQPAQTTAEEVVGDVAAKADDEVADDEMTAAVPVVGAEREEERTQVIEMLIATRRTQDLSGRLVDGANRGVGEAGTTQIIRPRERAAAAGADHGEETQVIKLPPIEGEPTQAVKLPPPSDGESTQVLRLRSGTQETGERTEVLPLRQPANQGAAEPHPTGERTVERCVSGERPAAIHDDRTTEDRPPAPTSIVDAERPDPADDPTTRLIVPKPGEKTGDDNGEVGARKRTMTVLNLERPRDEVADDTRPMTRRPLPSQRRPDDETMT